MNRTIFLGSLLSCAVLLAACAHEEPHHHRWNPNGDPDELRKREQWHSPVAALMRYDANHDGTLTREELEAGLKADFDRIDVKHTGCLSPDEVAAENARRQQEDAATYSPLIDWKQQGCIDFDTFAGTTRSLFESLDKNGDGKLTPDEINPKGKGPHGEGGRSGERHGRHGGGGDPDGD